MTFKTCTGLLMLSTLLMSAHPSAVKAQDESLDGADDVLNTQQIDIDGSLQSKPKKTAADRIEQMRKKLEEQNEQMVQKKIEDYRVKEEQKLGDKLQDAFNNGLNSEDSLSTTQASVQKVEQPAPEAPPVKKQVRVIPSAGVLNIKGQAIDFESKMNLNLGVEGDINQRFSAGATVQYATLDVTDLGAYTPYNYYYTPMYFNYYGQTGREMNYSHLALDLYSKFYILTESRVRPYVGLGVGYNRANLKYAAANGQSSPYNYNGYNVSSEQYATSYVSGKGMIGTLISFSESVGMNAEFVFAKGLTSGMNTQQTTSTFFNPDQERLNRVGSNITGSSFYALNIGLVLSF